MAMVDVAGDLPADNGLTGQVGWLGLRPSGDQSAFNKNRPLSNLNTGALRCAQCYR